MRIGNKDKIYIFIRDNKKCFYCGKRLNFRQITLDHYLPLSKGGKDEIFNLVTCCKKCNKYKSDVIPDNYKDTIINLFIKAVQDGNILRKNITIDNSTLKDKLLKVNDLEITSEFFIFQSNSMRFYIKDGFVYKIIYVDISN